MTGAAGILAAFCCEASAEQITPEELADLPPADVVILGEVHDNPIHHANQTAAVGAIGAKALVFEMLTDAQALQVRPQFLVSEEALEGALGWSESGWPDFAMYYPIFVAAKDLSYFGGALPRDEVRRAVGEGAAAVFGDGSTMFGLDLPLPEEEQLVREAGQLEAHCDALPEAMLGGMVEAQRLRDAALARAVIAAFQETGGPVAVIAGAGHARTDWGVPAALALAAPELTVLSIGQMEAPPEGEPPYDLWLVTEPAERDDPCAGFAQE